MSGGEKFALRARRCAIPLPVLDMAASDPGASRTDIRFRRCDATAPMRRRLYLMRHAEVRYVGSHDVEQVRLTERGVEQAEAARRALDGGEFDLVLTSGLPRTVETAEV